MRGIFGRLSVRFLVTMALVGGLACTATGANALVIAVSDSDGRAATADVSVVNGGTQLQVILSNFGDDVLNPSYVLTGMFFDLANATLTPHSALLTAGSVVLFDADGQPAGGNVGGEWAYASGLSGAPGGATQGISSTGLGLFGDPNFNGPDLDPPMAVNGLNYGLTSMADDPTTGNAPVTGGNSSGTNADPLIQYSVTFLLDGTFAQGFDLNSDLDNVSFQYGTSLSEPNLVSEPGTLALLSFGLLALGWARRRRGPSLTGTA